MPPSGPPGRVRAVVVILLAAPALAGCVGPPEESLAATAHTAGPTVAALGGVATAAAPLLWSGLELTGQAEASDAPCVLFACSDRLEPPCREEACLPACEDANCDVRAFTVDVPEGWWDEHDGGVLVAVRGPESWNATFTVAAYDAGGVLVAIGERGWFASAVWLEEPAAGVYEARVLALRGESRYEGGIQVASRVPGDARATPPDLVTLPPRDLRIEAPDWDPVTGVLERSGVAHGCRADEALEQAARRCLRFGNAVGNAGEGALEVRLKVSGAALAAAGQADWIQRVHRSDGTFEDVEVGPAVFHAFHGHYHYSGLATYTLHRYDLDTGVRGEQVGETRKAGFCFLDVSVLGLGRAGTTPPRFDGQGCLQPQGSGLPHDRELFMGIASQWFDLYDWQLAEQYVDVTGLDDGVYELVSEANSEGTLRETDLSNNAASVVLRLEGDSVDVLGVP